MANAEDFVRLIEGSPDGIAIVRDGRYVYTNRAWARALETNSNALMGRAVLDDVVSEDRERLTRMMAGAEDPTSEFAFLVPPDARVFLQLSALPLTEWEGQPARGFIGRDVTSLKRSSAQLLLADRMMSIGTLAAGVAHEINNPLSYVLGNLSYLVEETPALIEDELARADVLEALKEAHEGGERVRRIVRDLQAFSRADQERKTEVNVNRIIESAINMAWIEIRHRARLVKELGEVLPVMGNEARLGQVILNLLLHAAYAMPEGKADQHSLRIRTGTVGDDVVIELFDNGPGIAPDVLRHLFDALPHRPVGRSGGLGLSIAHSIIVDLGGSLTAEGRVGAGTTFRVSLPGQLDGDGSGSRPPAAVGADIESYRILVIDDEPLIATALKRALKSRALSVVDSGKRAIDTLAAGEEFDVIFCDLMMPELTGMDVYEWVKQHLPGVESRIVFMTGGTFTPRAQAFLEAVPNPRLEKPFEVEKVRQILARVR